MGVIEGGKISLTKSPSRFFIVVLAIFLTPALLFMALPPINLWFLAFISLIPLLVVINNLQFSSKAVGWIGLGTGAVYWAVIDHQFFANAPFPWIGVSPVVAWTGSILVFVFLALLNGLGWGIYSWLTRRLVLRMHHPLWLALAASVLWVLIELIRTFIYWNFTWGVTIGYSLPASSPFGQWASLGGVWLVAFGIVFVNWLLVGSKVQLGKISHQNLTSLVPALGFLLLWAGSGYAIQLGFLAPKMAVADKLDAVAIQSHQSESVVPDLMRYDQQLADLQSQPHQNKRVIVLPEVTYGIDASGQQKMNARPSQIVYKDQPTFLFANQNKLAPNTTLVAGFVDTTDPNAWYNGAGIVSHDQIAGVAYKRNLFAFGEYLPLKQLWPEMISKFYLYRTPSQTNQLVEYEPRLSLLFCNEIFQPNLVARDRKNGSQLIAAMSSDFDVGTLFYTSWQTQVAAYRAVETWQPLVLAADQGQSVIVNPDGRILAKATYLSDGIAQAEVSSNLPKSPWVMLYSSWSIVALASGLFLLWLLFVSQSEDKKSHGSR